MKTAGLIYVGTGQNYSSPANGLSDAILAIRLDDGGLAWARQLTENDAWNGACFTTQVNCPEENGPDFDFGAPPFSRPRQQAGHPVRRAEIRHGLRP